MMLSAISHSMPPPFPQSREHLPSPTMTTSLAILPQRQPSSLLHSPPTTKRPTLRIDTQQIRTRTFGKGSSLRLETLSAVSPTARNTFSNAYEAPASAAPASGRPSRPQLSINNPFSAPPTEITSITSTPNSACTPLSTSTVTSTESATLAIPYKQPHNLTSILSNSPARPLLPRKMAPTRPLFPATKSVSFRTPLEEEIKTVKYTMAHSDIESSQGSLSSIASSASASVTDSEASSSTLSLSPPESPSRAPSSEEPSESSDQSSSEQSSSSAFSSLEGSPRPREPRTGEKRDSSSSEEESDDSCPETPVAGRRKRSRDWRWTLGPLEKSSGVLQSGEDSE